MANVLAKQYKEFPVNTSVKIVSIEQGLATVTFPSSPLPKKKYLIAKSYITHTFQHTKQDVQDMYTKTSIVSPGRPSIPAHDWSKLDAMPITYPNTDPSLHPIRVECYCGHSFAYYSRVDIATQAQERQAVDTVIAQCTSCTEYRATSHNNHNTKGWRVSND